MPEQDSFYSQIDSVVMRARGPDGAVAAQAMLAELRQRMFGLSDEPLVVGQYRILRKLGHGGMGAVYEAYDPKLDRRIALKVVKDSWVGEILSAGLAREARAMARLAHPNVVTVHEVGEVKGEIFIAMELVEGQDLWAWQKERRPLRATLAAYLQAGEGLVAAHRAGFAHGDFKPHNALMGKDGRVRVLDFGLARAVSKLQEQAIEGPIVHRVGERETLIWGGTPAYMAPEQYAGRPADQSTDQFSFCVALYEALYGEHPFGDGEELLAALPAGRIRPPPPRSAVPAWIRRCLLCGMAANRADRFPTLVELLAALAHDPRRQRRRWAGAALVAMAASAAVLAPRYIEHRRALACRSVGDELEGAWDEPARERVAKAFGAEPKAFAAASLAEVGRALDAYADRWIRVRRTSCEAERARAQTAESSAVVNECLRERRSELAALVGELERADTGVILRAVEASTTLTSPETCREAQWLTGERSVALESSKAARRAEIFEQLARSDVLIRVGHERQALELAKESLARAVEANLPAPRAAAELQVGYALTLVSQHADAVEHLKEATWGAIRAHDDRLAVRATGIAMQALGVLGRRPEGEHFRGLAEALLARQGLGGIEEAKFRSNLSLFLRHEHLDEAEQQSKVALAAFEDFYGADHLLMGVALGNLGTILGQAEKFDDARDAFARSRAILEARLGHEHPRIAMSLANLVNIEIALGNDEAARQRIEEAMAIHRANGETSRTTSCSLPISLCEVLRKKGEYDKASEQCAAGTEICKKVYGEKTSPFAEALGQSAELAWKRGQTGAAEQLAERALAIFEGDTSAAEERAALQAIKARALFQRPRERARAIDLAQKALPVLRDRPRWRDTAAELSPIAAGRP